MKVKGASDRKLERVVGSSRVLGPGGAGGAKPPAAPAGNAGPRVPNDDVALSPTGRLVGAAGEAVNAAADVRPERVQPLRASIAAGDYDVNSIQVADRILRMVLTERRRGR